MSTDGDAGLAGLLQRVVADSLAWLGEYPADCVDAGALTAFRQSLDWFSQQLQDRQGGRLASGGLQETALRVAAELFVDLSWWLDTCPDEEVELDVAVSVLENGATFTYELSDDQRQRLVEVLGELAAAERHEGVGMRYASSHSRSASSTTRNPSARCRWLVSGFGPRTGRTTRRTSSQQAQPSRPGRDAL
ncbi:hypothetical protein ACFFWC_31430 [Plantactinospora siamensis]|uniref:Uncharacterized protein n=1 Tax=Plantactinospora siamensis TaxID=555372 RepID=A0ABV6P303_9ACTN